MLSMNLLLRRCRQLLLAVLLVLFATWAWGEAAQWLFRWHAQHLLADIRSLDVDRSTWSDARPVMHKWIQDSTPKGACTQDACNFEIDLVQTLPPILVGNPTAGAHNWLPRLVDHLGLRNAAARAGLTIEHGVVTTKWFGEQVTPPLRDWHASVNYIPYLSASSEETSHFHQIAGGQKLLHPNRMVQHKGSYVAVTFAPDEDPAERATLMDFRFTCITRLNPCETQADILPEALQMLQEQELTPPSR
jgi:hypothetical protein